MIKNAIEPNGSNGHKPRKKEHTSRELPFLRPVTRLGTYPSFDAALVVSHLDKFIPGRWSLRDVWQADRTLRGG